MTQPPTLQWTWSVPLCSGEVRATVSFAPWRTLSVLKPTVFDRLPVQLALELTSRPRSEMCSGS